MHMNKGSWILSLFVAVLILMIFFGSRFFVTVPVGHIGVASLFGKVQTHPYPEGLHAPVNPLYNWTFFDARQKTTMEAANVPSQDQLQTKIDVSVQFRLKGNMAPTILKETGTFSDAVNVHLLPKLRSLMREQGKTIQRAEDFFLEETQEKLQVAIENDLSEYLEPKGIELQAVLIRDITLPDFIAQAIESKKEREQAVERQKAELERFKTEQQQKIAAAEAERRAAEQEAEKRILLADAQAYEVRKLNEAIASNPAYIQLQAIQAMNEISKNPANTVYFINGDSPTPLPLMHMGDVIKQ